MPCSARSLIATSILSNSCFSVTECSGKQWEEEAVEYLPLDKPRYSSGILLDLKNNAPRRTTRESRDTLSTGFHGRVQLQAAERSE